MAEIDHLVYAVPDLEAAIADLGARLGVHPVHGGAHPGMGTRNALLSLGSSYLEVIAVDPAQPDPPGPRPFGVDGLAVPSLVTFAARPSPGETIEELVEALRSVGHDPGDPVPMTRTTPAGETLAWRLTFPTPEHHGVVPFLIDWGETRSPAATAPGGVRLERFGAGPDAAASRLLDVLGLAVPAADAPGLTARLRGPVGTVEL